MRIMGKLAVLVAALVVPLAPAARAGRNPIHTEINEEPVLQTQLRVNNSVGVGVAAVKAPMSFMEVELESMMPDRRMLTHISREVEYHSFREQVLTLPMRRPRVFNAMLATSKTWLADLVVQVTERSSAAAARCMGLREAVRPNVGADWWKFVDWNRSLAFALFGLLYEGLFQWLLLVTVMSTFCPNAIEFSNQPFAEKMTNIPGQIDLVKQVIINNFIFAVFFFFPMFYVIKQSMTTGFNTMSVVAGMKQYKTNFASDNLMNLVFNVPGDFVVFAAPMFMRLPLDHSISFAWTMVLSYVRGESTSAPKDAALNNSESSVAGSAVSQAPPAPPEITPDINRRAVG